jgi:hypothetical protein
MTGGVSWIHPDIVVPASAILLLAQPCAQPTMQEQTDMSSHEQRSNKERKKQPSRTAKEKKAAKQAKKHAGDHQPLIGKKKP